MQDAVVADLDATILRDHGQARPLPKGISEGMTERGLRDCDALVVREPDIYLPESGARCSTRAAKRYSGGHPRHRASRR